MAPRPRCPRCDVPLYAAEQSAGRCNSCGQMWQSEPPIVVRIAGEPECPRCEELRKLLADVFAAFIITEGYPSQEARVILDKTAWLKFKARWEGLK